MDQQYYDSKDYTGGAKSFADHIKKNRWFSTLVYFLFIPLALVLALKDKKEWLDGDAAYYDKTMWWVFAIVIAWNIGIKIKQYHKYKQLKRGKSS